MWCLSQTYNCANLIIVPLYHTTKYISKTIVDNYMPLYAHISHGATNIKFWFCLIIEPYYYRMIEWSYPTLQYQPTGCHPTFQSSFLHCYGNCTLPRPRNGQLLWINKIIPLCHATRYGEDPPQIDMAHHENNVILKTMYCGTMTLTITNYIIDVTIIINISKTKRAPLRMWP